jgi:transcriptional regulator with XRE-family HTH domain
MARHHRYMADNRNPALGEFLRSRRAALRPDEAGVPNVGSSRRVPGLRREEVALLAGVSVHYYTRLEQGESHLMSDSVADAIARALRLDENERLHMRRLLRPAQLVRPEAAPEKVRESLLGLVESRTDRAAFVLGRRMDFLAGNRLAYALYGFVPGEPTNQALRMFLDPTMRAFYLSWERHARQVAASLRMASSYTPDDPGLAEVLDQLTIESSDFVRIWSDYSLTECTSEVREFDHPLVGRLTLNGESLRVPDDPGQKIIFMTPEPGSESAERLRRLAAIAN